LETFILIATYTQTETKTKKLMKNSTLVIAAQNGCQKSLSKLYAQCYPLLVRTVKSKMGGRRDSQLVEDIAQESMIKGFQRINEYKPSFSFNTWLGRIAYNLMIDFTRKNSRTSITTIDGDEREDEKFSLTSVLASEDSLPDMMIIDEETKARINAIIKHTLSEDMQEVIKMRYFDGLSYEDMKDELDIPMGTLKAQVFRAHKALKKSALAAI